VTSVPDEQKGPTNKKLAARRNLIAIKAPAGRGRRMPIEQPATEQPAGLEAHVADPDNFAEMRRSAMTGLRVPVGPTDHILGSVDAPTTLLEYGDYECPHCGAAYPIVEAVRRHFGNRLRFVFRHFPLNEIHPHAEMAAETAEFAGAQGRFWEMHALIFENQNRLGAPLLFQLAAMLGLSQQKLREALDDRTYAAKVRADFLGGVRSGVTGTPTFFIDNRRFEGLYDYETLVAAIDARLAARASLV
jgi:protein-disulfide isomerase